MASSTYSKQDIALRQLESALRLYDEGLDYFSVITLAGAAEEILGQLVRLTGKNALDDLTSAAVAMHRYLFGETVAAARFASRANHARNSLKHLDEGEHAVTLDPAKEAVDMLNRAILNYWLLETKLSESMGRFESTSRSA